MTRIGLITMLAAVLAGGATNGHAAEKVVFFDDFTGPELDRSKWNVVVPSWVVNQELQAYVDDRRTVAIVRGDEAKGAENGALAIRASWSPGATTRAEGRTFDFISGRLDTRGKFEFAHGTAAARMKLPAGAGLWPAFWALGSGKWPDTGEIDIMENIGDPSWVSFALHGPGYYGDTPLSAKAPLQPDATAWHVYSVDWSADELVFRIDGAERYRVTRAMVEKHGPWAFDDAKYLIVNLALGGAYPQSVNKATEPYFGLPQASVDLVKAGKAEVLVDWVKVTRREP